MTELSASGLPKRQRPTGPGHRVGGTRTFVFTFSEVPKSVNAGGGGARAHPMKAHKEKMRWERLYVAEYMVARVPKGMAFVTASAIIRFKRRPSRVDSENFRPGIVKPLADSLVRGGYLPDDTDDYFKFAGVTLEFPGGWPWKDPRVKHELIVRLEARYA